MSQQKVFWFRRGNERPFACEKNEAWELYSSRSQWRRKDIVFIGTTDGSIYLEALKKQPQIQSDPSVRMSMGLPANQKSQSEAALESDFRAIMDEAIEQEIARADKNDFPQNTDVRYVQGNENGAVEINKPSFLL